MNNIKKKSESLIRIFLCVWAGIGGYFLASWFLRGSQIVIEEQLPIAILVGLLTSTFFIFFSKNIVRKMRHSADTLGNELTRIPLSDMLGAIAGLILGLIVAVLLNSILSGIGNFGTYISFILLVFIPYTSTVLGYRKRAEIYALMTGVVKKERSPILTKQDAKKSQNPKIIDTSAIIDGRILFICRTGFLEGQLIITNVVLDELRHIADSDDDLRRAKGRQALDTLNHLREEFSDRVEVIDIDYPEISEVDTKLVRLAQEKSGSVITTDYNLNKVAQLQGVKVYNVNELSNAVKPVVIPGEEMTINVIKAGKERNQGIAYLDDGTMIVVEDGKGCIGKTIDVVVTSALQTAAGRMIFVKSK